MIAICITTYNQRDYISQAIKSAQMQICDEPLRIYIGDDASKDGTSDICINLANEDKRIIYIRRPQNIGLVKNTLEIYRQILADGCEYIAMLDGDDYWIASNKLQMQLNFLREHPNYGFVHTAAYDDINGRLVKIPANHPVPTGDIHLKYNCEGPITTNCTVLFRTELLKTGDCNVIDVQHFLVLDYPLYGIFAQRTLFGYIDTYTAAWRNHTSVSNPKSLVLYAKYQYHYVRAWKWLNDQYNGNFHYSWIRGFKWCFLNVWHMSLHRFKIASLAFLR